MYHSVPPVVSQKLEDLVPLHVAFADAAPGLPPCSLRWIVAERPGNFLSDGVGVAAAAEAVADVHLHDHVGPGVAEEDVPDRLAVDLLEVAAVGVVADPHAHRLGLGGQLGEELGRSS